MMMVDVSHQTSDARRRKENANDKLDFCFYCIRVVVFGDIYSTSALPSKFSPSTRSGISSSSSPFSPFCMFW